jgi:hypothetical protein
MNALGQFEATRPRLKLAGYLGLALLVGTGVLIVTGRRRK